MHASPGDRLRVKGHRLGSPDRCAEILDARGPGGTGPFLVRWDDNGHETLFFPSADAVIEPLHHAGAAAHS